MKLARRSFLHLAAGAAALPGVSRGALALDYPTRPIHWVIGFPPGGGATIVARIMGRWLSERLGQQVVIENKPGAGTNIATEAVVNAPPDGYTLLWVGISNAINAMLYVDLPFDFLRDIAPVAGLVIYPLVIEANPSVPAKNIAELVALAKDNPGKITMASYGTGTISHVAGELFKRELGVNMVHVPYRGGAPMVTDLLGGQVQVGIDVVAASLPHIRSGALRALAVTTAARLEALPDVPTVAETIPGYEAVAWTGVGVPRGTPEAIIKLLNREINAGLVDPTIKAQLTELTVTPMVVTSAEFGAYMTAETERWTRMIKLAGIKME
ncbi:MAG: tripartite tricarboxylate transporter substrate binding protein [Xanthobacteraceae bacterium]